LICENPQHAPDQRYIVSNCFGLIFNYLYDLMSDPQKQFFFVHIPKTAGTTFALILTRQFRWKSKLSFYPPRSRDDLKKYSSARRNKYDLCYGHLGLESNTNLERGIEYFTFLREPRERLLSGYKYIRTYEEKLVKAQEGLIGKDLKSILKDGLAKNMDNTMVRYLSGSLDKPYLQVNDEDLRTALKNFDTNFSIFGLTEYFDESLVLLSEYMKWEPLYYVKENRSKYKIDPKELDEETEAMITQCNRFDQVLYNYALAKFKKMLEEKGMLVETRVKELREGNEKFKGKISRENNIHQFLFFLRKKLG
jgi:hypothetical protein